MSSPAKAVRRIRPLITAGLVIGAGLAGFFDGIVFHQILQWHHMLSSTTYVTTTLAGLEVNTLADGLFHAGTYVLMALGFWLLWRATNRSDVPHSNRVLLGAVLAGAGLFNLIEGTINHHILKIHHVREVPDPLPYDLAFLFVGALLAGLGYWVIRSARSSVNSKSQ